MGHSSLIRVGGVGKKIVSRCMKPRFSLEKINSSLWAPPPDLH